MLKSDGMLSSALNHFSFYEPLYAHCFPRVESQQVSPGRLATPKKPEYRYSSVEFGLPRTAGRAEVKYRASGFIMRQNLHNESTGLAGAGEVDCIDVAAKLIAILSRTVDNFLRAGLLDYVAQ